MKNGAAAMAQIGETELDMRALSRALWRRAWLLVALGLAVAVATYLALGSVDPVYTADTSLLIEERESPLTRPTPDENAVQLDESAIQSHVEVLRSRQIANTVIDRLDLIHRPDFDPATRPSLIGSLLVVLGLRDHPAEEAIRQRIMDTYYDRLSVFPLAKSRVISVQFEASDPELAAEVANAVAKAFVDLQQGAKRESAVAATDWLQQEIERLRERVAEAERTVADYRASNELFSVNEEAGSLSTQQLSEINAELARARAARAEAQARAGLVGSLLQDGGALDSSQEVLDSALVQRLRERQVALRAEIADLSTTLLPGHPRIRALQGQLNNLDGQVRQEVGKVQASLNTAARVAAAREQSLMASLNEAKVAVNRSNGQEIELRALEREAAAQRDLLESLLGRYREALARTDADYLPADARIISRAVAPGDPSFPKKPMMSLAAGLAAFLIGAAILLMGEFTSGRAFRVVGYAGPLAAPAVVAVDQVVTPAAAVVSTLRPAGLADPVVDPEIRVAPVAVVSVPGEPEVADAIVVTRDADAGFVVPSAAPERFRSESARPDAVAPAAAPEDTPDRVDAVPEETADGLLIMAAAARELTGLGDLPAAALVGMFDPAVEPELPFHAAPSAVVADPPEALAPETPGEAPETASPGSHNAIPGDRPDMAELAELLGNPAVRVVLFAGVDGGEGAGVVALSVATQAAGENNRFVLIDVGKTPSEALGGAGEPGLGELLAGEYAFGEVIRRDEGSRVHVIPMGSNGINPPLQRMQLVVGALTHTYDKVVVVANSVEDWPHEYVRPDVAAIVCRTEAVEGRGAAAQATVLERGARAAVVLPFDAIQERGGGRNESAAA